MSKSIAVILGIIPDIAAITKKTAFLCYKQRQIYIDMKEEY